jgi:proliferating cell nuclear antigen
MAPLFELQTGQTTHIKTLFETLNNLVTECTIRFYPPTVDNKIGGVIIQELNKTNSLLIHCKLDANQFEHYEYNSEKSKISIGITVSNLLKCLKCMNTYDIMTWRIDENDINRLVMILENPKEKKIFKINLMDLEDINYEIDDIEFAYSVSIDTSEFQKNCKDMNGAHIDKMEIKCTEDNLFFSSKGDIGVLNFQLNPYTNGIVITKSQFIDEEIFQGTFELKYLTTFTKCTSLCTRVLLCLKNEYPLVIKYSVSTLGELKFTLSPTKENDLY